MTSGDPFAILKHPLAVFAGMAGGVAIGLWAPGMASRLGFVGDIFVASLKMCALPIVITSIVMGVARLLRSREAGRSFAVLLGVFGAGLAIAGFVGVALGRAMGAVLLAGRDLRPTLAHLMATHEVVAAAPFSLRHYLLGIVPANIFQALSEGHLLSILFFFGLLGVALGKSQKDSGAVVLSSIEALNDALFTMIGWLVYLLPFGFCAIFAQACSRLGIESLPALAGLLLACVLGDLTLLSVYAVLAAALYGKSFARVVASLKETLIIAFGTSSSLAALPYALRAMESGFGLRRSTCELALPLGVMLNPQGAVVSCTLITVFVARVYGLQLGPMEAAIGLLAGILLCVAGGGMPAVASLSMLPIILRPLGLPAETVTVIFLAIVPIMDPLDTVTNTAGNCACAALVERWSRREGTGDS